MCVVMVSCEKFVGITFFSEKEASFLYVYVPEIRTPVVNKDTTIKFSRENLLLLRMLPDSRHADYPVCGRYELGMGTIEGLFKTWQVDTVRIFLFDRDVVDNTPWTEVAEEYMVLQRYDLSEEDFNHLGETLYYPTSVEMKGMHLWPRYETASNP